jgi:hypothetical protein
MASVVRKIRMQTGSAKSRTGPLPKATAKNRKVVLQKGGTYRNYLAASLKLARRTPSLSSGTRHLLQSSDSKRTKGNPAVRSMWAKAKKDYRSSGRYAADREQLKKIRSGR